MRITDKILNQRIDHLNDVMGYPLESYSKGADGRYKPNANVYLLDSAYGGVKLVQMSSTEGCTGISEPLSMGYGTKKECYLAINSFISGIYAAKRQAQALEQTP